MKANELRIGNYYKWYAEGNEYIYQVDAKDFTSDNIKNFDPIPLTEEWLLKFGFIKLDNNKYGIDTDNNEYWIEFIMDRVFFFIAAYMDSPPSVSVKYVHQLQNLYFALTGEELTQVSEGKNKNFV